MSAKRKMRDDLMSWKMIAENADKERIRYGGIVVAILAKFGGELVIGKDEFAAVTKNHAVQSTLLGNGDVKLRMVIKKPDAPV